MKKISFNLAGVLLVFGSLLANAQQNPPQPDSLILYYQTLAKSGVATDQIRLRQGLNNLANKDENNLMLAIKLAGTIKTGKLVDSLKDIAIKRYPRGRLAMKKEYTDLILLKAPAAAKEKAYIRWIKNFPEPADHADMLYDYARTEVAYSYASENNAPENLKWINRIKFQAYRSGVETGDGQVFLLKKDTVTGERLIRMGVADAKASADKSDNLNIKASFYNATAILAALLYKEQRYKESLKYATEAYNGSVRKGLNITEIYALALTASGRGSEAFALLTDEVKSGKASAEVKSSLKTAYIAVKGSEEGYAGFFEGLKTELQKDVQQNLARQMIDEVPSDFTLVDLNGKKVSLQDLRGKVVVLDFWATWCLPCKKSFSAMQMAINKYKNDPNVEFLFIDTWERIPDPKQSVSSYIAENKYTFHVLLDDKNTGVVDKFGITGIPAKFVIGSNGKIRFKLTGGFDGPDEAAVEEISAMVEMARK